MLPCRPSLALLAAWPPVESLAPLTHLSAGLARPVRVTRSSSSSSSSSSSKQQQSVCSLSLALIRCHTTLFVLLLFLLLPFWPQTLAYSFFSFSSFTEGRSIPRSSLRGNLLVTSFPHRWLLATLGGSRPFSLVPTLASLRSHSRRQLPLSLSTPPQSLPPPHAATATVAAAAAHPPFPSSWPQASGNRRISRSDLSEREYPQLIYTFPPRSLSLVRVGSSSTKAHRPSQTRLCFDVYPLRLPSCRKPHLPSRPPSHRPSPSPAPASARHI